MIKQSKKKFAALLILVLTLVGVIGFPAYALAPVVHTEEIATESEIAEQKSVIDEQAMMLQSAGVSLALNDSTTLALENNDVATVGLGCVEEEPVEVYNNGWTTASVNLRKEPNTDSDILTTLKYGTAISYTNINEEWIKIEYEEGFAYMKDEYISDKEPEPLSPYVDLINNLTDDEKYLIYQITFLEAGNQSMEGQRAVIEVILNRVLSDKYPNTVEGVLSQSGQFTTWRSRNSKSHNEEQEEALELVCTEEPVLTLDYLMFSRGKFSWGRNYVKIGDHWFGTF